MRRADSPFGSQLILQAASLLLFGFFAAAPCRAADDAEQLAKRLRPLIRTHRGEVAVAVKHLKTGASFSHRENEPMPTASLIKFPIMVEAYRRVKAGKLRLDKMLTLKAADKVPGSGILTKHFSPGMQLSLRDAIRLMIAYSDNTATNLVLDEIGIAGVNKSVRELGFPNTKLHAKVFRGKTSIDLDGSRKFGLGRTTAKETLTLYEKLYANKLLGPKYDAEMRSHLLSCEDTRKLKRNLPDGLKFVHKGGAVAKARCDAGVMETPAGPIAVCVFTRENRDRRWSRDNAAERLIGEIARRVYWHFNRRSKLQPAFTGTLKPGDSGRMVEALQRTLNARIKPSPSIAVDGDYGPQTKVAVAKFQTQVKLKPTGIAGPDVWRQLGPLQMRRAAVPPPSEVNSAKLAVKPADKLDGPPLVTCRAWAIADGKTGKLLFDDNASRRLDFASTTKIMTAYLVVELARNNPKVLDETIEFSQRADDTIGSTSGLLAGERTTVRELMYGLMLPSGNDASVALAEHFGARFARNKEPSKKVKSDPLELFVDEMNRTARRLGMDETTYRNTHGLTARGHKSSARDLVKLAHAALKNPLFRKYVNTRQHGATVTGKGGYQRNVVWKNTNRLLGIEGYAGVKTGTTSAARACLVSYGQRGDRSLIVVVLGSAATESRYTDTRNLYRWAWKQLK